MANVYSTSSLGIKAPSEGFQQGGWYEGRQYWGGTLSDPGVIHPSSNQQGSGQAVSDEVNLQSDKAQGNQAGDIKNYLAQQTQQQQQQGVVPSGYVNSSGQLDYAKINSGIGEMNFAPSGDQFNLPELYKKLTEDSGVKASQAELDSLERQFTEAKGKINDNPYLSEATRVGRVSKLESLHAERSANIRNEVATKKADTETQLNLEMKQFDINSQQAEQALSRFNTLLTSGALDNASGEDIATLTRSTGIPSSMLYSAINGSKAKNQKTELIKSEDDNGIVTITAIDQQGNIVNQQSLGAIGNKQDGGSGGGGTATKSIQTRLVDDSQQLGGFSDDNGKWWGIFPQLVALYATQLSLQDIYRAYSSTGNPSPIESAEEIQGIYDEVRGE